MLSSAWPDDPAALLQDATALPPAVDDRGTFRRDGRVSIRDVVYGIGKAHTE